jgi:hypothetical protein
MALQCAQLPITISAGFDKTPKAVANYRKSFYGSSSQAGLKNSNFTLQARFLRHCKRDVSRQLRLCSKRTVCVRAKEPKPTFIEMTPITGEAQFDAALESGNPVIIDWCSLSPHSLPPVSCLDWFHLQMHLSM